MVDYNAPTERLNMGIAGEVMSKAVILPRWWMVAMALVFGLFGGGATAGWVAGWNAKDFISVTAAHFLAVEAVQAQLVRHDSTGDAKSERMDTLFAHHIIKLDAIAIDVNGLVRVACRSTPKTASIALPCTSVDLRAGSLTEGASR